MGALLDIRNVSKSFGGVVANRAISLSVPAGGIVGLIGPNGSGKTTLFNSIVGYHPIDGGSITFCGKEISGLRVPDIARLGLIRTFQQTRVFRHMTVERNILISQRLERDGLSAAFARVAPAEAVRAGSLLEFVGLHDKRHLPAGTLSFGQQKLLELAMALMNRPSLLLLDEPTAGINPTLINDLVDRLRRSNLEFGVTLLIIEHNMQVIMSLADEIYCLAHGEPLASGPPDLIRNDPRVLNAYLGAS